jgi:uncharacterized protein (DUF305 family)
MNTKLFLTAAIALVIGGVVGHAFTWMKLQPQDHMMADGSQMHGSIHSSMSGEMDSMTTALTGKTGDDFDKVFLAEMITHHQGAVQMAQLALKNAKHQEIKDMAQAIITAQNAEILQMQNWQKNWYGQ